MNNTIKQPHPPNYRGYPFISVIVMQQASYGPTANPKYDDYLMIIDNTNDKRIKGYVIDLCPQNKCDEEVLIALADKWWQEEKDVPFSIVISRNGLSGHFEPIYKSFNINFLHQVIGPIQHYQMKPSASFKSLTRRARKAPVDPAITSILNQIDFGTTYYPRFNDDFIID